MADDDSHLEPEPLQWSLVLTIMANDGDPLQLGGVLFLPGSSPSVSQ